jgi:dTDP-4-dehydrorhamnose reductase
MGVVCVAVSPIVLACQQAERPEHPFAVALTAGLSARCGEYSLNSLNKERTMDLEKYMVLGANGQVGHSLVQHWAADEQVIARDREMLDVGNPKALRQIAKIRPDVVINCAAATIPSATLAVKGCLRTPEALTAAWKTSAYAARHLAEICSENDIPLVWLSDACVFEGSYAMSCELQRAQRRQKQLPCRTLGLGSYHPAIDEAFEPFKFGEDDQRLALNIYGQYMVCAENEIQLQAAHNPLWQFYIIRTANLVEHPWRPKRNFAWELVQMLGNYRGDIPAVADAFINITYVPDLVRALVFLVTKRNVIDRDEGVVAPSGVYHITNTGVTTWYDVALCIARQLGYEDRVKPITLEEHYKMVDAGSELPRYPRVLCLGDTHYSAISAAPPMPPWDAAMTQWCAAFPRSRQPVTEAG